MNRRLLIQPFSIMQVFIWMNHSVLLFVYAHDNELSTYINQFAIQNLHAYKVHTYTFQMSNTKMKACLRMLLCKDGDQSIIIPESKDKILYANREI